MGRMTSMRPREGEVKSKEPNPLWRGIGCFMFIGLTVGAYFVADAAINALNEANRASRFLPGALGRGIPRQFVTLFDYKFPTPARSLFFGLIPLDKPITHWAVGFDIVTLAFTLFVAILLFSLITLVWAGFNRPKLGPKDAPPVRRKTKSAR